MKDRQLHMDKSNSGINPQSQSNEKAGEKYRDHPFCKWTHIRYPAENQLKKYETKSNTINPTIAMDATTIYSIKTNMVLESNIEFNQKQKAFLYMLQSDTTNIVAIAAIDKDIAAITVFLLR